MEHVSDIELIDLLGGHLSPERQEALEGHLATCADCAGRRANLARTWNTLGEWDIPPNVGDLAEKVVRRATRQAPRRSSGWPRRAMRVAAAVLLTIGVGHGAGRWVRSGTAVTPATPPPIAHSDEQAVTDALYLAALDGGSGPGIAQAVLELPTSGEENE
jgi:anti-sigma factor RsiW